MSGPLATHRTPSHPLVIGGETFVKTDNHGNILTRWVTKPGGVYEDGRCIEWRHFEVPRLVHVLDHSPAFHRPSKHARGRTRPRTAAEQIRFRRLQARMDQLQKSYQIDLNRVAAELGSSG